MNNKIGLLGGTFDPIHEGHLAVAHYVLEKLNLNHVEFIPCYQSPHRSLPIANSEHRVKMIELAIQSYSQFKLNLVEIQKKEVSYTVDTLKILTKQNPTIDYYTILGADAFLPFHTWKNPDEILKLVKLVVVSRDKFNIEKYNNNILFLSMQPILISATEIRKKIQLGKKNITGLDLSVENYIVENKIYSS